MQIYHYTSLKNWQSIQTTGFLENRSLPVKTRFDDIAISSLSERSQSIIVHDRYIVGLGSSFDNGWIETGLFDLMCRKTTAEVCLGFDVPSSMGVFVREHAFCSPQLFVQQYGVNLREKVIKRLATKKEILLYKKHVLAYLDSVVSLEQYDGSFQCPEYRCPYAISIDLLTEGANNY